MISMTSSGGQSAPESRFSRPLKRGGACLTCRRLKIRCDGARPCGSCQRKPKDDPSRTRAIEDKISRLEARIREYGCPDSPSVAHTPLHSPYTLLKKDIDNHSLASINRKKGAIAREAGNVKFKAGNFAGAIEDYEKAIKSDPADTLAHNNRAAAYTELFAFIASENKRRRARDTQSRPLKVMTDAPQPPTRMTISTPSNFIFPGSPTLSSDSPYFTPSNSLSEHYLSSSSSCTTPPPLIRAPSSPTLSKNNFNLLSDIERRPKKGNENSVDPKSMLDPPRQHGHSASAPTVLPIPHESIQIPDPPCLTSSLLATISRDNGNPEDVMSDFDLMPNNENHEDSVRIWDAPTGILEHVDSQSSKSGACAPCRTLKARYEFKTDSDPCTRCLEGEHECVVPGQKKRCIPRDYLPVDSISIPSQTSSQANKEIGNDTMIQDSSTSEKVVHEDFEDEEEALNVHATSHDSEKDMNDNFEDETESLESEPCPQPSLPIPNELSAGTFFSGSQNFTINGGEYQSVNGDKHTTINNKPTINVYNIYPGNHSSPPVPSNPPATSCTPTFSSKRCPRRRRSRWSITTFTHMVYHHYLPAVMHYPVLWTGYVVPIFVSSCPWA